MKHLTTTLLLLFVFTSSFAQVSFDYEVSLKPVEIPNLAGLHSYAYAQFEDKWLVIGGRKDGLHARQPFNAFPTTSNNTDIYVIDVNNLQFWSATVNTLPTNIKEQLQSTNMNFYQDNDSLYIIGGYAFSEQAGDHITFPYLTSVHVSGLINAIINSESITPFFKQIKDDVFAVTGGHLKKLANTFYLVGGHRFDGRYNPMGNPSYTQTYTNQIRKFTIKNSNNELSFDNYSTITDPVHLRRRDYNLLSQIFPNGEEGFTISSGVFQQNIDLPFLYPVDISENGYTPITNFNQYLSNYHSAVSCLYDSILNEMHSIFFGGMSRYYYQNNELIEDNQVPFVKTISRLTRDSNGTLYEYQLPIEMPGLKGSSAEFIYNKKLPHYNSKIIKLSEISDDSVLIGHIFGGIYSPSLNPFSNNVTTTTSADATIYEIWLKKGRNTNSTFQINGENPYNFKVFPNPFKNNLNVELNLDTPTKISYFITNELGQVIEEQELDKKVKGNTTLKINLRNIKSKQINITIIFNDKFYVTKKAIVE